MHDRIRTFTLVMLALGLWGCEMEAPPPQASAAAEIQIPHDWLIFGGQVVDGTGAPPRRADVLLRDGRISHVGVVDPDTLEAVRRFDGNGRVVAPGFIDVHAHGDPLDDPDFSNFLAMGVTTILLGQDGSGPDAASLGGHLDAIDRIAPRVNVAFLLGHNTLRQESGIGFDAPSSEGSERMANLVAQGMAAGAFGLSTGLEYVPGSRADLDELTALARAVAAGDGVVMSHLRNEDADRVEASIEELLAQGRRSGARVHASHLKVVLGSDTAQARRILDMLDRARAEGVPVTADVYPYTASFTGLSILFPDWARPPNDYDRVVRERRDELASHLRTRVEGRNGPEATLFGSGPWRGRTLADVARERGEPFEEVLLALGPGGARAAYFVMDEDVMTTFLRDPHVVVASDGSPTMAHPRGYGAFARVIRRYVVEERLMPLEEAIRRMTGLPSAIVGFDDPARVETLRGRLEEGWAGDVVVFDPTEVRDRAEYDAPHRLAEGMEGVWVNGALTFEAGALGEQRGSGRAIRKLPPPTEPGG